MEWKPVTKYNGLYLISDTGKVFSVQTNKIMKTYHNKLGYERVELNVNGVAKKEYIHRLVAETFLPNPDDLPCVNHKDENPMNNDVSNLEWCTYEYNSNYGTCIERRVAHTKYRHGAERPGAKKVYRYDMSGNLIAEYPSVADAGNATGYNKKSIAKACGGGLKKYMENVWSYEPTFQYDSHKHYENRNGTVYRYDLQGNLIKTYNSPDEIRADGLNPDYVNRVCKGVRKTYMNCIFKRQ